MPQRATYYGIKSAKVRILFKSPRVINVGFQSVFQLDFSALVILELKYVARDSILVMILI